MADIVIERRFVDDYSILDSPRNIPKTAKSSKASATLRIAGPARPVTPETPTPRSTKKHNSVLPSGRKYDDDDDHDRHESEDENNTKHSRRPSRVLANLSTCLCAPDPKIPRPRNAFILYRQYHQKDILARTPGLTNPEISKALGDEWRKLDRDTKSEWLQRAEEEKIKHQLQYPEYRYQPKRTSRRSSVVSSPDKASYESNCSKCGLPLFITDSPPTPLSIQAGPLLFDSQALKSPTADNLQNMHSLTLASPGFRRDSYRQSPVEIAPQPFIHFREPVDDHHNTEGLPDAKRRRFGNGGQHMPMHASTRPYTHSPYPFSPSTSRDNYGGAQSVQMQRWNGASSVLMGPPPRPIQGVFTASQQHSTLTLPPLQQPTQQVTRPFDPLLIAVPSLARIRTLGRISPPLKRPDLGADESKNRGVIIAIEGDSLAAIEEAYTNLSDLLRRAERNQVRLAQGPSAPENATCSLEDYHAVISEWQKKSKQMIEFVTKPPGSSSSSSTPGETKGDESTSKADTSSRIPIILMKGYQLHACNTFATSIPITDTYTTADHWQWIATLWRGIVGADYTVYVQDATKEEMAHQKDIEVSEDSKYIVVRRQSSDGGALGGLEDKTIRRLGFEISEWITSVTGVKSSI